MQDSKVGGVKIAPAADAVRLADLLELTKPRISIMVVLTAAVGFLLAAPDSVSVRTLAATLLGTLLLAAGASALNMVVEREADGRMVRTAGRPLPAGRLEPELAYGFAVTLSLAGLFCLAVLVGTLSAVLGAATLLAYILVYTPLKRITPLATLVGAVPGAMPPLIGWSASQGSLDSGAWILFTLLFFWQLPHFFAIAWMYREDYERGGFALLPVVDVNGERTASQTVIFAVALLLVSLLPPLLGQTGPVYALVALGLGLWFVVSSVRFARTRSRVTAKRLMLLSLVYLPAVLVVLVVDWAA